MPLQFALRPRFDLERPSPRRRRRRRFPALALSIAAYWLGIAGATHALLRTTGGDSSHRRVELAALPSAPSPASLPPSPEPDFEPAPAAPAAPVESPASVEPVAPKAPAVALPLPLPPPPMPSIPQAEPRAPERSTVSSFVDAERRTPPPDEAPGPSLPSCESAAASANESIDLRAAPGAPDLTREALASVLDNGAYLARCALPARTALDICAAVQNGKVVGVSVALTPANRALNACVGRAVAALRFPTSERLDVTRTRFEAAR